MDSNVPETEGGYAGVYCASLFAKCDLNNVGRVKVSCILQTMLDLQIHAKVDIPETDTALREELLCDIKKVLDPSNEDPEISLSTFTQRITSYLEEERHRLMPEYDEGPGSSTHSNEMHHRRSRLENLDSPQNNLEESSDTESVLLNDLKAKISDLELQVRRLSDDNANLRSSLDAAQEENFSLLQTHKQEQLLKENEYRQLVEKEKRLKETVNDKELVISSLEENNLKLSDRIILFETEFLKMQKDCKDLMKENDEQEVQMKNMFTLLASKDETLIVLKEEQDVSQKAWQQKEKDLYGRNQALQVIIEKLERNVESLKLENLLLESNIVHLKAENENSKLKVCHISPEEEEDCTSPQSLLPNYSGNNDVMEDDHLEAEIMAAGGDSNFPIFRKSSPPQENCIKFDAATQYEQDPQKKGIFSCGFTLSLVGVVVFGILLILLWSSSSFFHNDNGCVPNQYFSGIETYFSSCGELSHDYVPII